MYLYCVGLRTLRFIKEDIVTKNYQYLWYTICVLISNHKAEKGFAGNHRFFLENNFFVLNGLTFVHGSNDNP